MLDRPERLGAASPAHQPADPTGAGDLVYANDAEPGITRRRAGKGFTYVSAQGTRVADRSTLARIWSLAVPPAWRDVWICSESNGHIQATGRDQRGRKQYRYHFLWSTSRDEVKFSSLADFAKALSGLREAVETDLRSKGLSRRKVVAAIVWLLDNTMIRVGNAAYARDNSSFGLTTLRDRHVRIDGGTLRFSFKGKSGKEWRVRLVDRRIARIVRGVQDIPGQHLFQYLDADGERHPVRSQDINDYIREACGPGFSSKHFRTWGATISAASLFGEAPLPEAKGASARTLNQLVDRVAALLGNTRSVCRKSYIHPRVIERWLEGTLADELRVARRGMRRATPGLDAEEAVVARWLARA